MSFSLRILERDEGLHSVTAGPTKKMMVKGKDINVPTGVLLPITLCLILDALSIKVEPFVNAQGLPNLKTLTIFCEDLVTGACSFLNHKLNILRVHATKVYLGTCAFSNCLNLKWVNICGNFRVMESAIFSRCPNLCGFTVKGDVERIKEKALWMCNKLTEVTIEGNIGKIDSGAFQSLKNLRRVIFKGNVGSVDSGAFLDCPELLEVKITGNVMSLSACPAKRCHEYLTFSTGSS